MDVLTLLSCALFVLVLIAFSSSPLTISPSEGGDGERGLILPVRAGLRKTRPPYSDIVFTMR
jgi:hypothetical protein